MPNCPKTYPENIAYRRHMLKRADASKEFRAELWAACARDPVYWIDVMCWTFNTKEYPDQPHRLFVTYPYQVDAVRRLNASIGKNDILIEKSRDMGATWCVIAVFLHRWLFKPGQNFLLGSRKEEYVDGDARSLLWKADYLLNRLPPWMVPSYNRIEKHLTNEENESSIDGEATNHNFSAGDRRTALLLDEFARVDNSAAYMIQSATRDVTNCRIFLSTPLGAFGAYFDQREKMHRTRPERIIRMHWTEHPEKARGLYYDSERKPRSPWYDEQCIRAASLKEIAQELDIAYNEAGGQYFDPALIDKLLKNVVKQPSRVGELNYEADGSDPQWSEVPGGRLKVWCPLAEEKNTPPQGRYDIGFDVSMGVGGEMSSNSTAAVYDEATGEKCAEFAYDKIGPHEFGKYAVALANWFHGAKLIWGRQGPGGSFKRSVVDECRYLNVYYGEDEQAAGGKRTRKVGYVEQGEARLQLFSSYAAALHSGRCVNRSREAVEEMRQFIFTSAGTVEHSRAASSMDPATKGKLHGDIVVADALACRLLPDRRPAEKKSELEGEFPERSAGGRLKKYLREQEEEMEYA